MKWTVSAILAGLAVAVVSLALGRANRGLQVGDPAPPFSLPGSDGKTHTLADELTRHKAVVLAWFPKAFTGG